MPASPASADPGWDDDLAWLDRDPMTAAERQASLDRLCEQDEGYREEEDEYGDVEPFTEEELAEIREAAADELLAVGAATTGRRGPGQPGSARVFPGESASPAAAFGPGMIFDLLPGCAQLAVAADAAAEDDQFAGVSEGELIGVVCAWDRVEAHAAARKLAAVAELDRRNPGPEDAEFTADQVANALGESRFRADELLGTAGHLDTHLPGTRAALRDGTVSLGKARIIATATGLLDADRGPRRRGRRCWTGRAADPGQPARRDRPRGDGGRPGQGAEAAGDRGEVRAGGAVGRGLRERRAGGPRAAAGPGAGGR